MRPDRTQCLLLLLTLGDMHDMPLKQTILTAVVAATVAAGVTFGVAKTCLRELAQPATRVATVMEHVQSTGVLRCGYTLYSVGLNRDAGTGELWGIYKDVVENLGKILDVKVEWTEEVGWGQQIEGLNLRRYDLICSPASMTGPRTRAADYSTPLYYSPVGIWVRSGDRRFDRDRAFLNDASVTLSTMDGEQTEAMARATFPMARRLGLPQNADFSQLLLNVVHEKADAVFAEPLVVREFLEKQSDTQSLVNIAEDDPLALVPNILLLKQGEHSFKALINNALRELFLNGTLDRAIDAHERYPGSYVRSAGYY